MDNKCIRKENDNEERIYSLGHVRDWIRHVRIVNVTISHN